MRLVAALVMSFALAAPHGDDVVTLSATLRNPRLTLAQRADVEARLLALGEDGALALRRWADESAEQVEKHLKTSQKGYLGDFARAARKLADGRLDRKATQELETLRKRVLVLRADANLTKERIHEVGDPVLARLNELLVVTPEQTLEGNRKLIDAREKVLDACFELDEALELWQRSNAALPEKKRASEPPSVGRRDIPVHAEERWLAALATPMDERDGEILIANRIHDGELDSEEAAGILDLNLLRVRLGLHALSIDLKLCNAARDHSKDMRELGFFAHESPVEGKRTPWDRAARAGTGASAENIAFGQSTGASANEGWWYSPGHHKNMLGDHSKVALGRSEDFWTQMFG